MLSRLLRSLQVIQYSMNIEEGLAYFPWSGSLCPMVRLTHHFLIKVGNISELFKLVSSLPPNQPVCWTLQCTGPIIAQGGPSERQGDR